MNTEGQRTVAILTELGPLGELRTSTYTNKTITLRAGVHGLRAEDESGYLPVLFDLGSNTTLDVRLTPKHAKWLCAVLNLHLKLFQSETDAGSSQDAPGKPSAES